jgi:ABC-2 type transport system ATP-binding protein
VADGGNRGDAVVQFESVTRWFGSIVALDGFSMEAPPGTVTVLVGPNGSGKTTSVRMITGALRPQPGTVRTFGLDPDEHGEAVRYRCGVVAAKPALYDRLSGRDNLRYAAALYGVGDDSALEASAARFGIEDALHLRVSGYSTGMKSRLALARAVLHDPELLLLDEPTSGLDPESSHAVLDLIDEMAEEGKTVLMCTHLLLEAEGLADQVVVLEDGRAVMSGTPEELTKQYWPTPVVVVDAEDRDELDRTAASLEGVVGYERDGGPATMSVDDFSRVPDVVSSLCRAGVRLTRVTPHQPTLEELYFAVRKITRRVR